MENNSINISTKSILKIVVVILGLGFIYLIREVLILFFVSVIIMAAIDPLVSWFKTKIKIPRILGVTIIYLFLISFVIATISFLVPTIINQFSDFLVALPNYLQKIDSFLRGISFYGLDLNLGTVGENIGGKSFNIFSTTVGFFTGIISFIVVFAMAFYMSIYEGAMENFLDSVTPEKYKITTIRIARKIKNRIGRWMSGQLFLMLIIFILDYAVLYFLGVPYALVIALVSGFLEIIPYIGPTIAGALATLITFLVSPVKAIFVLVFYVVIQQIESNIIFPQVMKKAVGLNPLAVILSMLIGLALAGVAGAILALPVATAVGVIAKELMKKE